MEQRICHQRMIIYLINLQNLLLLFPIMNLVLPVTNLLLLFSVKLIKKHAENLLMCKFIASLLILRSLVTRQLQLVKLLQVMLQQSWMGKVILWIVLSPSLQASRKVSQYTKEKSTYLAPGIWHMKIKNQCMRVR
uniref:Uncharacterized protein n=1 Tax=Arundo donax TaxID=35708 RepID=A0A0A9ECI3_ARUDO